MANPMMADPNEKPGANNMADDQGGVDNPADDLGGAAQDMAVIQIPKAELDTLVGVIGQLQQLLAAAADKAGSDIAAQNAEMSGGQSKSDADMIAELEAQSKGGY